MPRAPTCKGGPNLAKKKILMTRMGPLYDIPYFLQIKIKMWTVGPLKNLFLSGVPPPCKIGGPQTRVCLGAPKGVNPPLHRNSGRLQRSRKVCALVRAAV